MKLFVQNKLVSLGGSSRVFDEKEQDVYKVKGKYFTVTKKKFIRDLEGNNLYTVRNKYWHFIKKSCFIIDNEGNKIAKIYKKPFTFKPDYRVEGFKDEIEIKGDFLSWTLDIIKNGKTIGTIRREFNLFKDCFVLETEDTEDMPFMVALVIAIDNILDNISNSHD